MSFGISSEVSIVLLTPSEDQPYITGNQPQLGNWNPGTVPLEKVSDSTWSVKLSFPSKTKLEYKFTLGSWEREALTEEGLKPDNYILLVERDTVIYHTVKRWGNVFEPVPFIFTGDVEVQNIKSPELENVRNLRVWLPPSYHISIRRYPVLYMHDGQNIFAPLASLSGKEWHLDETATELIASQQMKEIIIVGIDNTPDRRYEYAPTYTGEAYSRFVVETVKSYVDSVYRTLPGAENTATAGASMGGLIAFHLGWEYADVFSMAGCLSPAFLYDESEMTRRIGSFTGKPPDTEFLIYNGRLDLDSRLLPDVIKMQEILKKHNVHAELIVNDEANHSEEYWAEQSRDMLLKFFGK